MLIPAHAQGARAGERKSITFILGEDEDPAQPMFPVAERYFKEDPLERTDQVVSNLRSLSEVREYLAQHPTSSGLPWGVVNLVAHANENGMLDVDLRPGGPKTTWESVSKSIREGTFKALSDECLDERSELRIQGCSVGKDVPLMKALSVAFGGDDTKRPLVRATPWFTCFQFDPAGRRAVRFLCESWKLLFRPGERPSNSVLATRLHSKYPKADFDLTEALSHPFPMTPEAAFSYESPVRFQWTAVYPGGDVPAVVGAVRTRTWLMSQESFQRRLNALGWGFHQLNWETTPTTYHGPGAEYPALQTIGRGRVIHVLKPIVTPKNTDGPRPELAWEDPRYYVTAR
ncbi:MAG: hypothetical protein IPP78_09185 [Holophagaceae bacterium]|nr:hypothetical protein [Holophagaceae bacterium]